MGNSKIMGGGKMMYRNNVWLDLNIGGVVGEDRVCFER